MGSEEFNVSLSRTFRIHRKKYSSERLQAQASGWEGCRIHSIQGCIAGRRSLSQAGALVSLGRCRKNEIREKPERGSQRANTKGHVARSSLAHDPVVRSLKIDSTKMF